MKKILIISGVSIDRTPVVKYCIEHLNKKDDLLICVSEYNQNRLKFFLKSFYKIFFQKYDSILFIGIQTLPFLFLSQFSKNIKINWFLESYYGSENNSFIMKIKKIEKFIDWKNIISIFPEEDRLIPYKNYNFKETLFLPNSSKLGNHFIERRLSENKIRIVFYGALNNNRVYLKEFIEFAYRHKDIIELDLYGYNFDTNLINTEYDNVKFYGLLSHKELLKTLLIYNYSVIGYRPIDFNSKYCSPNKLYEALSFSLPTILNSNNPTLIRFYNHHSDCCIIHDFSELNDTFLDKILDKSNYSGLNKASFDLYQSDYNLEKFINLLEKKIRGI